MSRLQLVRKTRGRTDSLEQLLRTAGNRAALACFVSAVLSAGAALCHAQPSESPALLIFPLEDKTGLRELSWVGEGVALSLSETLEACGITTVDRDERILLIEQADLPPGSPLSRGSMIRIGQTGAVDGVVFGTYSGSERDLKVALRFLDLRSFRMSGEVVSHGPLSALPESESELARSLAAIAALGGRCGRPDAAIPKRVIPNSAFALFVRSLQATDEEEQLRLAERAVGIYGDFPAARYSLGRHFALRGDCPSAIRHLEPVRGAAGVPLDALLMLGTCMLQTGEIDGAIQILSSHLSFSRGPETLNNLGVAYLKKGEFSLAAEFLTEARRAAPAEAAVLLNLAVLRHMQQNPAALLALIRENSAQAKASAQMQLLYAEALAVQGDVAGSEEALARARLLGSDPVRLHSEDLRSWARVLSPWLSTK